MQFSVIKSFPIAPESSRTVTSDPLMIATGCSWPGGCSLRLFLFMHSSWLALGSFMTNCPQCLQHNAAPLCVVSRDPALGHLSVSASITRVTSFVASSHIRIGLWLPAPSCDLLVFVIARLFVLTVNFKYYLTTFSCYKTKSLSPKSLSPFFAINPNRRNH